MKKLHSFAFYALVTPALTLGTGSVLAEQSTGKDIDGEKQGTRSTQHDKGAGQAASGAMQGNQSTQRAGQSDSHSAVDRLSQQSRKQNQGYIASAPANGMQASDLIGADVKTKDNESVGPVDDLIIDQNGQIVAIVVSAGGFLGMGEKEVAIGWGRVTASGTADEQELRVDVSREDLHSAPEFKTRD